MSFSRVIVAAAALCFSISVLAQTNDVVRVRKAEGRWEVSGDVSAVQAEERALMEAKKEALRKAGVMESVWSVMGQVTSSDGTSFSEAYSSVSTFSINGLVNVIDKKVEDVWDPNLKRLFKVVTIEANVTKDDVKEDLSYKLEVKGIEPVYKEDDIFMCSFNLYGSDSYVKVFWFTNDDAAMLYPNDYEGDMVFKAGESYTIPVTDAIELVMAKSDPDVDTEFINLVVVATKKNYPYLGKMDMMSILSWIYSIPADQRVVFHDSTIIK